MTRITLKQIVKRFAATVAVDRVDLTIAEGELFFLLGPSGCGKSTLLRMIAGLIEPSAGAIHFGQRDVTRLPTGRRNAAMVFQGYALWPHMTVYQNVEFGLSVRKAPREERRRRVDEALAVVRMTDLAGRRPGQLSGGQQQRVALARAIVVRPDVLLLDEPLSNLDAKLRIEMRSEIRRICAESKLTTVYVTHDQEEALSMADRIAVMRDGRLCQVGPPAELYSRPQSRFVAGFLGHTNLLPAKVAERSGGGVVLTSRAGTLRSASPAEGLAAGGEVFASVRPEAFRVLDGSGTSENLFSGRVVESVYLGHVAQHVVELSDGTRVMVDELRPRRRWEANEPVRLGVDPQDVVVLLE